MTRSRVLLLVVLGVLGYVVFGWLFPRFSYSGAWGIALSREESIARARVVAAEHGFDVTGWPADAGVRVGRQPEEVRIHVGFLNPRVEDQKIGVLLDPAGRPTAVVHRRERRAGDDVTVEAVRPIAERAFLAFVPNASQFRLVAQEDLGDEGARFRWERPGKAADVLHVATVDVAGSSVRDIRYYDVPTPKSDDQDGKRPIDILDVVSNTSQFLAVLFGLVLFLVAAGRSKVPVRMALLLVLIGWGMLVVEVFADLHPDVVGIFTTNPMPRWGLVFGTAILAIPGGLSMLGAYPSLRRVYAAQLISLEELLLRGRFTSRRVGAAVLAGVALGGWVAVVPYLIRATGAFGGYRIRDGVVDAVFGSGLVPVSIGGDVLLVMLAFSVLAPLAQDKVRGRAGIALALALAFVILVNDSVEPIGAALLAGLILTVLLDQLLRKGDLLALIGAAVSASWATSAATILAQPAQSIQTNGWTAVIAGSIVAAGAVAISQWGTVKPYLPWEPGPARAERERIQVELDVARQAQRQMLPATAPALAGTSIASICRPAKHVGGDLYDFLPMNDGKVGIAVADVSGKGVPAAFFMTITKGLLLAASDGRSDPLETLTEVNAGIHSLGHRSIFVTILLGVFDPARRTFEFVRAGHTPLLWRKASGEVASLSPRGIGIGMASPRVFSGLCERSTISTGAGDFLFLYSDGVTEAMNESREEFGDERLVAIVRDRVTSTMTAEEASAVVARAVEEFCGSAPAHDDMTIVVLKSECGTDTLVCAAPQ